MGRSTIKVLLEHLVQNLDEMHSRQRLPQSELEKVTPTSSKVIIAKNIIRNIKPVKMINSDNIKHFDNFPLPPT